MRRFAIIPILAGFLAATLAGPAGAAQPPAAAAAAEDAGTSDGAMPDLADIVSAAEKVTAPGGENEEWSAPIKLAIVFAGLALLPAALVMMTSFTRIVIVLSFIRRALTTQNIPPNVAVIGLALFLTLFTMAPTFTRINAEAIQPYLADEVGFEEATDRGFAAVKLFLLDHADEPELQLFAGIAGLEEPESPADVPMHVAIPAFAISEFKVAFEMGALLFIPFLLIDLVVAGILLSAGMMMLPPVIISLPFKIILFVLVDGWQLLADGLVKSFY